VYYNFAAASFHTKKLCSRLYWIELEFYFFKLLFEPPFEGLRGNVCTPSKARWKARGWLPITELFAVLRLRRYNWKSVKVCIFWKGWVTFSANFRRKRGSPTNHCLCQKTGVIAVLCGIKISTVHCLVLSQSTCVTNRKTDGQNYDSKDSASIAARAVKMVPFAVYRLWSCRLCPIHLFPR